MERERFLDAVAERLGRPRLNFAPKRLPLQAPWPPFEGPLETRFAAELTQVGGTVSHANCVEEVMTQLAFAIFKGEGAVTVASARSEFEALGLDTQDERFAEVSFYGDTSCRTPDLFRQKALSADLGLTTAVSAVASTGTLILTANTASPRSVSLLPRRHLAVLHVSQIAPDLGSALALGKACTPSLSRMPSALLCITGPSRTSDIENDLSIGVHGPAEVHVILYSGSLA